MSRKTILRRLALASAAIGFVWLASAVMQIQDARQTGVEPVDSYILIDAGHGGADGGAVAADGTLEKDINLAIARPVADLLRVFGYTVKTTRDTDVSIHDADVTGLKDQKVSDIHNRLALVESSQLAISIHQNQFSQSQYFGAQVFYAPKHPSGEGIGKAIRESIITHLQPENTRPLKKGSSDVYLMKHATVPTVLVECGFLSNPAEREKLKTEEYQRQMAFAIAAGVLHYAP